MRIEASNFSNNYVNDTSQMGCSTKSSLDSIFCASKKVKKSDKNDKNLNEQQIMMKAGNEQTKLASKYNVGNNFIKAENIEKALKSSKVPGLSGVPSFAKLEIKSIGEEINNLLGSIANKCADCKSEEEIKNVIKDIESELQQKKHTANVLLQRSQKAQELDKALSKIYSDPKKAQLAEKLDISKIVDKLTGPIEEVNVDDIKNQDGLDDKSKDKITKEKFDEALKNDEISNVIDSLIKYLDKGEKDKILDNYMKDDTSDKKAT